MADASMSLPVIDLAVWLTDPTSAASMAECRKAAQALETYSAFALRDPRVREEDNARFLDMMEDYFAQPTAAKQRDARPEYGYQVGVTPELTEVPRCGRDAACQQHVAAYPPEHRPAAFDAPDPKWRFFWRIGPTPPTTQFAQLNADAVVPAAFPSWRAVMDGWGQSMTDAVAAAAQMLAVGWGLPRDAILERTRYGPHLLAPTGADLTVYGAEGTVLAGFHTDLNLLTIHGKSRFPGLHVWTRDGRKLPARVPDGCLLVQAGKQIEYMTAGEVHAGFHEVVVGPATREAMARQQARGRPLWRVSSTLFFHTASDQLLEPLGPFKTRYEARRKLIEAANAEDPSVPPQPASQVPVTFPPLLAGHQVAAELGLINLTTTTTS